MKEALCFGITLTHNYVSSAFGEDEKEELAQTARGFAEEIRDFVLKRMKEKDLSPEVATMATLEQAHRFAEITLNWREVVH